MPGSWRPFASKPASSASRPAERQEETGFLRMVIDMHGKPLVLEEQLLPGSYPPPLDEIKGISSALGIAELTSDTPYPGTLWSLIERMEALAQISTPTSIEGRGRQFVAHRPRSDESQALQRSD